ncbi:MAG: hypothetical protein WCI51_02205 [Lentisphaerota bacterium]
MKVKQGFGIKAYRAAVKNYIPVLAATETGFSVVSERDIDASMMIICSLDHVKFNDLAYFDAMIAVRRERPEFLQSDDPQLLASAKKAITPTTYKAIRVKAKLTQRQLGELLGLDGGVIYNRESGRVKLTREHQIALLAVIGQLTEIQKSKKQI